MNGLKTQWKNIINVIMKKIKIMENYKLVDLGLPSGTFWMDRNVGADSPEDADSILLGVKQMVIPLMRLERIDSLIGMIMLLSVIQPSTTQLMVLQP